MSNVTHLRILSTFAGRVVLSTEPLRSDFDLDLRYGLEGENTVKHLMSVETIEVKRDRRWKETGNIYIETSCYSVTKKTTVRSGLLTSKATHWAFVLEGLTLIVSLDDLITTVERHGTRVICNIEPNPSSGYLITVTALLKYQVDKAVPV